MRTQIRSSYNGKAWTPTTNPGRFISRGLSKDQKLPEWIRQRVCQTCVFLVTVCSEETLSCRAYQCCVYGSTTPAVADGTNP
ncbi:hypothetical protein FOTG_18365 [Fusarium oxysporum f. sp. vasinfectum 25433]|uniref:Uncharacterized protein n=1 Tax=Fusarium oxysporum f. sp. vasinfectum 25433 TaxID=1089449 RepID=X0KWX4_FUSOX|nr:hypothetical protein FOTG_18365 [Fusarium oxysporum f. sp. vasinfectum 25433]